MKNNVFTTVKLSNGTVISIKKPLAGDMFRADVSRYSYKEINDIDYGITPFFLEQILFKGKNEKLSIEEILEMSLDDFNSLSEIVEVIFKKIPKL